MVDVDDRSVDDLILVMNSYIGLLDEFAGLVKVRNEAIDREQLLLDQTEFDSVRKFREWVREVREAREVLSRETARANVCREKVAGLERIIIEIVPAGVWVKFNENEGVCVKRNYEQEDDRVIIREWSSPMPKLW